MGSQRLADAFSYAAHLHRGQLRKGTRIPYLGHLMGVASLVLDHGGEEDHVIAALLHDAALSELAELLQAKGVGVEASQSEPRHRRKEAMEDLRYPVGRFTPDPAPDADKRRRWIDEIAELPERLTAVLAGLPDDQLDTPYRPGGWTVRQLVHHLADSHVNAYTRFRLALTESAPLVKTYDQDGWADLADARSAPVDLSLRLLSALHHRWVLLLRNLDDAALRRKVRHPEWGEIDLETNLQMYAWHGRHHLAHLTGYLERGGWRRA